MSPLPAPRFVLVVLIGLSILALDLIRPPSAQWSARALLAAIDLYQATGSRLLGAAGARCRFEPTCSRYGEAVIRRYGALEGSWLALGRIARCGPWTPAGTVDPPPSPGARILRSGTPRLASGATISRSWSKPRPSPSPSAALPIAGSCG